MEKPVDLSPHPIRILALGDSYTIGEGVAPSERWPVQLAARLRELGLSVAEPLIIARTGWTTGELMDGIQAARPGPTGPYTLVTLLIGVNNQYRGYALEDYRGQFRALLMQAIGFAGSRPGRALVLLIPDWGVTPFAAGRDAARIAAEIDAFNQVNAQETATAGANYVDITPLTRQRHGPDWLAADGLHPSGKMYAAWVNQALPVVLQMLDNPARS